MKRIRKIKTKVLGLVFLIIGVSMFKVNAQAFVLNEQEKCSYVKELEEKPSQEFAKGVQIKT